jgi:hypothetical protein
MVIPGIVAIIRSIIGFATGSLTKAEIFKILVSSGIGSDLAGRILNDDLITEEEERKLLEEYRKKREQQKALDDAKKLFPDAREEISPIVLDLDGDGVETTNVKDGAYFDHDGNGFAEQTGWAASDDGLLVMDRNNDGIINDGKELFGDQTILSNGQRASNGFEALAELDDNHDGKIDASDAAFVNLKVWKDIDGDGYSSADELHTLEELGIESINTGYADTNITDAHGNTIRQTGAFTKTDGATGNASDVWFQTDKAYTIALQL